jgi:hypothetical protein
MSGLSSSKIELAQRCIGAFTLPWRDSPNVWSKAGTERHAVDETAIQSGDVPLVYTDRWPGFKWRAEVKFVYNVATGEAREITTPGARAYGDLGPFDVTGTADVVGRCGPRLVIVDKKSFDDVTRAEDNPQVRFIALAASVAYQSDYIDVAINHELSGLDVATLDAFDLDETAVSIRRTLIDVAQARSDARDGKPVAFNTGRQCRWCPAFDAGCPKQLELVQLVKREDAAVTRLEQSTLPILDDENAPDVYALYKQIGILHKRIGQSLYAHAADRPIMLSGGRAFGKHEKLGNRKYDGKVVHDVVTERYGREVADSVIEMTATQSKLESVLKLRLQSGSVSEAKKSILDEVESRGGMDRKETTVIEEYAVSKLRALP